MTFIAITQRTEHHAEHNESRDALDQRWHEFLNCCGATPLIIPNDSHLTQKIIKNIPIQGILLSGGNDSSSRAETETLLLEFAIQQKIPVIGICHGMQVIQKYFGLKLQKVLNHVSENLEIIINGIPEIVNSYHDYGTTQTSQELLVWAKAHDGVVKAIRHCDLPIVGIMWHPERYQPVRGRDIQLIKKIFLGEELRCEQSY
ncbi:MAG: hypothetical protein ACD_60C00057G0005 [uncultured bacterium]|nr:MAG: hypothetical protein ACD_60C00057G0005 [uncultured bacterium]